MLFLNILSYADEIFEGNLFFCLGASRTGVIYWRRASWFVSPYSLFSYCLKNSILYYLLKVGIFGRDIAKNRSVFCFCCAVRQRNIVILITDLFFAKWWFCKCYRLTGLCRYLYELFVYIISSLPRIVSYK